MIKNSVTPLGSTEGLVSDGLATIKAPRLGHGRASLFGKWQTPIAAAVVALTLGLCAQDANALALGRVNVLSVLGEPLLAEIEVPAISTEEAATLRATVANPEAFRAAGMDFNSALATLQISLQRRADGSAYLRLSSDRTVNDAFVDLILEANWASGRIVRDYTLLFDPANFRTATTPTPSTPPTAGTAASAVAPSTPAVATALSKPALAAKDGVAVKAGDTAGALAAQYKPSGVSLDQMLIAMLRGSPNAFIGNNVNRLRAGAVIDMKAAASNAASTSAAEARQTILAQSKDFNDFRRRLASGAPVATASIASRASGGKVQANISESKAQGSAPDKLLLSRGSVAAKAKEDAIAKTRQAKDDAARVAELSKNIQDLNKISPGATKAGAASAGTAAAAPAGTGASAPGIKVAVAPPTSPNPTGATATPALPAPAATASAVQPAASAPPTTAAAPTSTSPAQATSSADPAATPASDVAAAPAPAPAPEPKPKAPPPPPPPPEPSFIESLMEDPLIPGAAAALIAVLGGLAFWRVRQQKKTNLGGDSSYLESRLQPDSFFGVSGGQHVDTSEAGSAKSSGTPYSPSQLDAAGDVDPVAEADVYLAYGRDLQAEEILKEAMRVNPSRVGVYVKLAEIYAKRRDAKAFETIAKEVFQLTKAAGSEWADVTALGRSIDPKNPIYSSGKLPPEVNMASASMATGAFSATRPMPAQQSAPVSAAVDLDLDLDFSIGGDDDAPAPAPAPAPTPAPASPRTNAAGAGGEPTISIRTPSAPPASSIDFDFGDAAAPSASTSAQMTQDAAPAKPASNAGATLEFDLGDLSLDLPSADAPSAAAEPESNDPLATKLELAIEFRDLGDPDSARSIAQEVAQEASGPLQARAAKFLADLG